MGRLIGGHQMPRLSPLTLTIEAIRGLRQPQISARSLLESIIIPGALSILVMLPYVQAYSEADPRVKDLAYIIKRWAKRRWMNNASEGTLSSYGYVLCLVHFLQTRDPPVVPNLQVM